MNILIALLAWILVPTLVFAQSFILSTTPRTASSTGEAVTFAVRVVPQDGFNATVFLHAAVPSLPYATVTFSTTFLNPPYADTAFCTVALTGPKFGGTHDVIITGTNGNFTTSDTVHLTIPQKKAWRIFTTDNSPLPSNGIDLIVFDKPGTAWIATPRGIASFDGTTWQTYDSTPGYPSFMQGPASGIAFDSEGSTWVSWDGILYRFKNNRWQVMQDSVRAYAGVMTSDARGTLWIASGGSPFSLTSVRNNVWHHYSPGDTNVNLPASSSIGVDHLGNVWLTGTDGSITRFDGTFWTYYVQYLGTWALFVGDFHDTLWFTHEHGLTAFDGTNWVESAHDSGGAPGLDPLVLAFDSLGNTWVAEMSSQSLAKFSPGSHDNYTITNSGLPSGIISVLVARPDSTVWIGTPGGLAILDATKSGYTVPSAVEEHASTAGIMPRMSAFPNPSSGIFRVPLANDGCTNLRVSLANSVGMLMRVFTIGTPESERGALSVDLRGLSPGVYILQVVTDRGVQNTPLVITR